MIKNNLILSIFVFFLSSRNGLLMAQNKTIPVNVGVVLDLNTQDGKIWLSCIQMAISDFYASHAYYNTRLVLNIRDSKQNVVHAANAALDLIKNAQVQAILGPVTSMQASFIISLADQAHVPIISFSATSPSLASLRSSYFFRITQNDSSQVKAISSLIHTFGWRQVVPIYADGEFGEGIIPYLTEALQEVNAHIPYKSVIPQSATDGQIIEELYKLMTMQTRVFIIHMTADQGSRLFARATDIGMMSQGYVWITTTEMTNRLMAMNSSVISSMHGVLGVETYVSKTKELQELTMRWKQQFQLKNPTILDAELDVYGLLAYDAAFALAMAIEKVGTTSFGFQKRLDASFSPSTDLESFEVSIYGPELSHALSITHFNGIAGEISFVNGQLQSSTFQIVNMNDDGARAIGFWTPQNGLVNKLNSENTTSLKSIFGPIIWPGDSFSIPKGWEIPTNIDKKLRIGIPVKEGYTEFVKITKDPSTNVMDVTGFCIDVFEAALELLPYSLSYEFVPFANVDGTSAGNYDDLCYQVYLGNFDAVVGDTTIRANRSLYVDFTMPYTESGVMMAVPVKDIKNENAWVFLKPLTWDLWLTISCFFVLIAFVVWVLEHQINKDFRGSPSHQVSTSVWFSFSTMVFSHREKVVSNLTRFVMIIWIFVLLILTQSYTASLASLITVERLQPTVTTINDLLRKGDSVGYINTSYMYGLLKQAGFPDSKLMSFTTMDIMDGDRIDGALSKGTAKGGIAAVIHEAPYVKLFVANYCSKYTMIGPVFKADGFGFVFPKRSSLVADFSQAILNVTEGVKILNIESKWFKKDERNCQDSSGPKISSSSILRLESFWVLFLITGVAAILSLIVFVASFLYQHRHTWLHSVSTPRPSTWERIQTLLKIFNKKDQQMQGSHSLQSSRQPNAFHSSANNGQQIPVSSYNLNHMGSQSVTFEQQSSN
ncbi:glutamate receptor 2.1-like [Rosa rugosa]|uniref:glutamate receptor 2.1-like n=1 Tax=Rosa rugosa TaxID=74645 RepID=UPI002B40470B|nr:glutamate receptor 2.1-like [Rosa rugosa]